MRQQAQSKTAEIGSAVELIINSFLHLSVKMLSRCWVEREACANKCLWILCLWTLCLSSRFPKTRPVCRSSSPPLAWNASAQWYFATAMAPVSLCPMHDLPSESCPVQRAFLRFAVAPGMVFFCPAHCGESTPMSMAISLAPLSLSHLQHQLSPGLSSQIRATLATIKALPRSLPTTAA